MFLSKFRPKESIEIVNFNIFIGVCESQVFWYMIILWHSFDEVTSKATDYPPPSEAPTAADELQSLNTLSERKCLIKSPTTPPD